MKQMLFMSALMVGGGLGATLHPYWPLLVYYLLAMLRPDFIWYWALPGGVPWSLVAGSLVAVSLLIYGPKLLRRLEINLAFALLVGFVAWLILANATAMNPASSWRWVEPLLKILAAALVTAIVVDRIEHVRLLSLTAFATLGYIAYHINSLYYFNGRLDVLHRGFGGLDNNGAALILALGITFAYAAFGYRERHWAAKTLRWLSIPVAVAMLHALMLTYSRGAMIACCAGLAWLVLFHHNRRQTFFGLAGLAVSAVVLAGPEVRERLRTVKYFADDASAQQRLESWSAAWEMVWQRPITGFGTRGSMPYLQAYADEITTPVVHNQYLQLAADGGIPLAIFFVGLLLVGLWHFRAARLRCLADAQAENDDDFPKQDPEQTRSHGDTTMSDWPWSFAPDPSPQLRRRRSESYAVMWLGFEAGLITLAVGGCFISIESVEPLWMILAIGCVTARVNQGWICRPVASPDAEPEGSKQPRGHRGPLPAPTLQGV
ncbi:MAG: O-antigen ligase family protein [Planctomycetota bacterium]